jgi:hypothetical protein
MGENNVQLELTLDNWLVEFDLSKYGLGKWQYGSNLAGTTLDSLCDAQGFIGRCSNIQLHNKARVQPKGQGYGFDLIGYKIDVDGVQEWRIIGYRTPFTSKVHFGFPDAVLDNDKIRLYAPNEDRCLYVIGINQ